MSEVTTCIRFPSQFSSLQDLHQVTADAGAEVEAFNAYAARCKDQTHDDGRQQDTLDANIASTNAAIENFTTVRGWWPDVEVEPMVPCARFQSSTHTRPW